MEQTTSFPTAHEIQARTDKALRLQAVADAALTLKGVNPRTEPQLAYDAITAMPDEWWELLAKVISDLVPASDAIRCPSTQTIGVVVALYKARTRNNGDIWKGLSS